MFFPRPPYIPIIIPNPEVLIKYVKVGAKILQKMRNKAIIKGKEHQIHIK